MTITLQTEPIMLDVRQTSHLSVQDIADPEARDNARAGIEKADELKRCIRAAFSQLSQRCARFLTDEYTMEADNLSDMPQAYVYDLDLTIRRGANKAEALEEAMRSFVVQLSLARFFASVNQTERSNRHSLAAVDCGNTIDALLYTKKPPTV